MPPDQTAPAAPLPAYAAYFAGGAAQVTGFLEPRAAAAIGAVLAFQEAEGIAGSMAEIGTFHGKTFVGLALATRPGETLLGVDLFKGPVQDFEAILRQNCADFGVEPARYRLHRCDSTTLDPAQWRDLLGSPARLVHIDGLHNRRAALSDLTLAAGYLAPRGLIIVDDFLHPGFPDVTTAVIDFLRAHERMRPVAVIDREGPIARAGPKLLVTAAEDEAAYAEVLIATFQPDRVRHAVFVSGRPLVL